MTVMGLPVVFATNRDQSKLENEFSKSPSYYKHLRSVKPRKELLIKLLEGLIQSFPEFSPQELMSGYIEQIPGISGKLSDEEIHDVIDKSVCGVSVWSE